VRPTSEFFPCCFHSFTRVFNPGRISRLRASAVIATLKFKGIYLKTLNIEIPGLI
jgi:hypothetical protein